MKEIKVASDEIPGFGYVLIVNLKTGRGFQYTAEITDIFSEQV